jgi:putative addiction module component (TIGR02574 family)
MKPLQLFRMPKALDEVTKKAMDLPPRQRLALASFLLESADAASDPDAEAAWDAEIRDRIREIDEGHVTGIAYVDVMREAERRLAP